MAVSVQDQRMVQQLEESKSNANALKLRGALGKIRDFIIAEVDGRLVTFRAMISSEDKEEIEADEARQAYHDSHQVAVDVFRTMHAGLGVGVALKLARGERNAEVGRVNEYLAKMSASDFASLSRAEALSNFERAHGYLAEYLPPELQPSIQPLADDALAQMKAAEDGLQAEHAEWIQAQAKLEQARAEARTVYLALRDILSGVMRLAGIDGKLNQVVPPIFSVLNPNTRASKSAPEPQPAVTEPATDDSLI